MNNRNYTFINIIFIFVAWLTLTSGMAFPQQQTVDLGVINGKASNLVKPAYPPEAAASKAQGAVQISVTVDEKGSVVSAKAVSGEALLQPAAIVAAAQSKFAPYLVKGKAVRYTGIIVYNFVLPAAAPPGKSQPGASSTSSLLGNFLFSDYFDDIEKETNGFSASEQAIYKRAKEYFKQEQYKSVIKELGTATPDKIGFSLLRAKSYLALKNYAEALKASSQTIADSDRLLRKHSTDQLFNSNPDLEVSGISVGAESYLRDGYITRGEVYEALGEKDKALADYQEELVFDREDSRGAKAKIAQLRYDIFAGSLKATKKSDFTFETLSDSIDKFNNQKQEREKEAQEKSLNKSLAGTSNAQPSAAVTTSKFKTDFDEFRFYFDEYNRLSKIYDAQNSVYAKLVEPLAEAKSRAAKLPDNTQLCRRASELNETYKKMRGQYDKMKALIDAGKMDKFPDVKKDITDEGDALDERLGEILSANYQWGCQVKVD